MSLLLDTHALLWWLAGPALAPDVEARIADPRTLVAVSAASVWEAAIKQGLGKLDVEGSLLEHVVTGGFEPLAISSMPSAPVACLRITGTPSIACWSPRPRPKRWPS